MDLIGNNLTEFLEDYLPTKFPNHRMSGDDFMTNCIFCEDTIKKLGINMLTGKWHCFHGSCEAKGDNFFSLYAKLEGITYSDAVIKLTYKILLGDKFKPSNHQKLVYHYLVQEQAHEFLPINPDTELDSELKNDAWYFLMSRKLFDLSNPENNNFSYAPSGFYENRVIIPYLSSGKTIYFQARSLYGAKPKYLCATENEHRMRGSDLLYPFNLKAPFVVVCEGPLDARSLQLQGVNATCTTGTHTSDIQMRALRSYGGKLIYGYDNDEAGLSGMRKADRLRRDKMMKPFYICHPPAEYKDWNEAHVAGFDLKTYVEKNSFENTFEAKLRERLSKIN
jgi:DNA primase